MPGDYLRKARESLAAAQSIAAIALHSIAAREAYLAAFHAAEAFIFKSLGRTVKTHRGLRVIFARLAKDEPRIDPSYVRFIANAYEFKSIADYGVDEATPEITAEDARYAIETAASFITVITDLLSPL